MNNNFETITTTPSSLEIEHKQGLRNFLKGAYKLLLNNSLTKMTKAVSAVALFNVAAVFGIETALDTSAVTNNDTHQLSENEYAESRSVGRFSTLYGNEFQELVHSDFIEIKREELIQQKKAVETNLKEVRDLMKKFHTIIDVYETSLLEYQDSSTSISNREEEIRRTTTDLEETKNTLATYIEQEIFLERILADYQKVIDDNSRLAAIVSVEIQESFEEYDLQKSKLMNWVQSEAYLQRLISEFGSIEEAVRIREERLKRLEKDYVLVYGKTSQPINQDLIGNSSFTWGHYSPSNQKVYITTDNKYTPLNIHEGEHQITAGLEGMSQHAIDTYSESFIAPEGMSKKWVDYYRNSTEHDARRKVLEYDLEILGIKNYEEVFTQEHYEKMMEAFNEGRLSDNSMEFIRMTKPQYEYFEKIMNTIAATENIHEDSDSENREQIG